jgi:N6-L-threonylcarbamoyladenine synthase
LGIETSCDETAVSVVGDGRWVYSNVISSSLNFHKRYKGVIPEIASRLHLETISIVLDDALEQARVKLKDINLIAVTNQPGLPGSLVVGLSFARALSFAQRIPLIQVNHLHAHLYAGFLNNGKPKSPFVGLVVSGGHTCLFYVKRFSKIELLGQSLDDACGEAYDKVATILGLGYPGGPIIERLARTGNSNRLKFSCSNTRHPLNFSFSGIKTAVLYYAQRHALCAMRHGLKRTMHNASRMRLSKRGTLRDPGATQNKSLHSGQRTTKIADVAASFQEAVVDILIKKSILACRLKNTNHLVVGGGVATNNRLREKFIQEVRAGGLNLYFSPKEFCTDNAAMVAGLGYRLYRRC